jgi:2-polyprenyl-3-methyl-5-hydroxy-6-metoxy-1,4-benzoquinol methylase/glycosyltransferase involved in cell wall biosynthesis
MNSPTQPTIGLAIIAKDEEESLRTLLSQELRDAVDEIVVLDTGSKDDTKITAKSCGAKVVDFKWVDDFAAARQASYDALGPVDFTLWADADDVIEGAKKLPELAASMPPEIAGFMFRYDYARDEAGNCVCELWRERLVRNIPNCNWQLPVHEVLMVPGPLVPNKEVVWIHQGTEKKRDPKRNYTILKASYEASETHDPRTLAYLGTESMAMGEWGEARGYLEEYLGRSDTKWDEERCQVSHKLSLTCRQLGDDDAARDAGLGAIQARPDWADGYLDLAELAIREKDFGKALRFCEQAEQRGVPQTLLIINPLEYEYQFHLFRSIALTETNQIEDALKETTEVLTRTPQREDVRKQAAVLAQEMKTQEATRFFLGLREFLVRHDENAKARLLMDCAPYFINSRPEVAQARLDQREMTLHADDPEVYGSYYRENPGETPFEAQEVPIEKAHEAFHRLGFLRDGLQEQGEGDVSRLKVLDLSANDGWMAANLSAFGVQQVDCMDLNREACERALGRARKYDGIGEVVCANLFEAPDHFETRSYDAVVCFETIEHVPDPAVLVRLMNKMCKRGGRCYISTPAGAYENGNIPQWAKVESKGHLRAISPHDLSGLLCETGVVEGFEIEQRLAVASWKPVKRKGKIVFYAGPAEATPERIITEGLGGSETALCKMAEQFASREWDVRVYAGLGGGLRSDQVSFGGAGQPKGQVLYAPATFWDPGETADLFVSSRLPEAFDYTIDAPNRLLWLHDADYGDRLTMERAARTTGTLVMSEFQSELLQEKYPFLENIYVTRNAIEPKFFDKEVRPRKPIVAYTSSPDRGLDVLLECWPEIHKQVPEAELHHCYAPVYHEMRQQRPDLQQFHETIIELSKADGVVAHDPMTQMQIAELYQDAAVWAYPSWTTLSKQPFPEISCISAVEAQAGGAVPVCLAYGALRETVKSGARIIPEIVDGRLSDFWREKFIAAIVAELKALKGQKAGRKWALRQDWEKVCTAWEETFLVVSREPVAA